MTNIKIVQLLPMPNDATYQGVMFGLGDDGVVYSHSSEGWVVEVPLVFKKEVSVLDLKFEKREDVQNVYTREPSKKEWQRDKGTFDHAFHELEGDIKNAGNFDESFKHLIYRTDVEKFYTVKNVIHYRNTIYSGLVQDFRILCNDFIYDDDSE